MDPTARSTDIEDELGFLIARLGTVTRLQLADAVAPLDITLRQFMVLRSVAAEEGLSQAQLGERLRIDASSIVQVLDDCQRTGLTERRPSEVDRRRYAIHLTEQGRSKLAQALRAVRSIQKELFSALGESQRAQLLELLLTLVATGPFAAPAAGPNRLAEAG